MAWRAFVRLPRRSALARCRPAARPGDEGDPLRLLATGAVSFLGVGPDGCFPRARTARTRRRRSTRFLKRSGAPPAGVGVRGGRLGVLAPVPEYKAQRVLRVRETVEGTLPAGEGV